MAAQGCRWQLAEQALVVGAEMRRMPETPACGDIENCDVWSAGLEFAAHAIKPQGAQVGDRIHAQHLLKRILQTAPADPQDAADIGHAKRVVITVNQVVACACHQRAALPRKDWSRRLTIPATPRAA